MERELIVGGPKHGETFVGGTSVQSVHEYEHGPLRAWVESAEPSTSMPPYRTYTYVREVVWVGNRDIAFWHPEHISRATALAYLADEMFKAHQERLSTTTTTQVRQ
jgi:hypothetical protein